MKIKPLYWELLLNIKEIYKKVDCRFESISITKDFNLVTSTNESLSLEDIAIIRFYPKNMKTHEFYDVVFSDLFPKKLKKIFSLYLGYILVNQNAEFPFTCVHIAQTLDGKIATPTGKSKWIGNKDNLIHAHRIRALVDAILIGGNTFRIDEPRLNVRLVKGENPIKIIVANSKLKLENLSSGKTFLMSNTPLEYDELPAETETLFIENDDCWINSKTLLTELKKKQIHSILIEGGAQTIRKFIEEKTLSRIEFHIAPIIFGSGLNGIELEAIDDLESAIHLKNPQHFKVGDAIMTISNL